MSSYNSHPSTMRQAPWVLGLGLLMAPGLIFALPFTPSSTVPPTPATAAPPPTPAVVTTSVTLPPFSGVDVCWPFNVGIGSCSKLQYGVFVTAEASVVATMLVDVEDDTLVLGTNSSFATNLPVKVLVSLRLRQADPPSAELVNQGLRKHEHQCTCRCVFRNRILLAFTSAAPPQRSLPTGVRKCQPSICFYLAPQLQPICTVC